MQTKLGLQGLDAKSVRTGPKNIEGCCSIKYAPIAPRENTVSNIVFPRKPCASKESSIPVFASMYLDMNLRAAGRGGSGVRAGRSGMGQAQVDRLALEGFPANTTLYQRP